MPHEITRPSVPWSREFIIYFLGLIFPQTKERIAGVFLTAKKKIAQRAT